MTASPAATLPKMFSEKRHTPRSTGPAALLGRRPATAYLERLLPDLRAAARYRAGESDGELDADELLQTMSLALLEQGFDTVHGAGYYLNLASWRARDCCERARTYRAYVALMPQVVDREGESVDLAGLLPAPDSSPEDQVIAAERWADLQSRLSPEQARMVSLLMAGLRKSEVAEKLGVSRARVSQHIAGLRLALADFEPA